MGNFKIKNQNGRSMIEMLGVLAIIGVLSVGGIAGYSKAMHKYRVNKAIEQITLIAGNVRSFFAPQRSYVGVDCSSWDDGTCSASGCMESYPKENGCPIIKKAKILPDEMVTVTDGKIMSITNPFGYGVEIGEEDKSKEGDNQAFRISYTISDNIEACIELLTQDWTNANVSLIGVSARGDANNAVFIPPANIDDVVEVCSHIQSGDNGPYATRLDFYFDADVNYWKNQNPYLAFYDWYPW